MRLFKDGINVAGVAVGAVVLAGAIGAGWWAVDVATSGAHGRGDQIRHTNNGTNRTQWYNHFYDLKTAYDGEVNAVQVAKESLAQFNADNGKTGGDTTLRIQYETNLSGAKQQCASTAFAYNNDSLKTRVGAQFKDAGLPTNLDQNACK
jgi:hypothetical protein